MINDILKWEKDTKEKWNNGIQIQGRESHQAVYTLVSKL